MAGLDHIAALQVGFRLLRPAAADSSVLATLHHLQQGIMLLNRDLADNVELRSLQQGVLLLKQYAVEGDDGQGERYGWSSEGDSLSTCTSPQSPGGRASTPAENSNPIANASNGLVLQQVMLRCWSTRLATDRMVGAILHMWHRRAAESTQERYFSLARGEMQDEHACAMAEVTRDQNRLRAAEDSVAQLQQQVEGQRNQLEMNAIVNAAAVQQCVALQQEHDLVMAQSRLAYEKLQKEGGGMQILSTMRHMMSRWRSLQVCHSLSAWRAAMEHSALLVTQSKMEAAMQQECRGLKQEIEELEDELEKVEVDYVERLRVQTEKLKEELSVVNVNADMKAAVTQDADMQEVLMILEHNSKQHRQAMQAERDANSKAQAHLMQQGREALGGEILRQTLELRSRRETTLALSQWKRQTEQALTLHREIEAAEALRMQSDTLGGTIEDLQIQVEELEAQLKQVKELSKGKIEELKAQLTHMSSVEAELKIADDVTAVMTQEVQQLNSELKRQKSEFAAAVKKQGMQHEAAMRAANQAHKRELQLQQQRLCLSAQTILALTSLNHILRRWNANRGVACATRSVGRWKQHVEVALLNARYEMRQEAERLRARMRAPALVAAKPHPAVQENDMLHQYLLSQNGTSKPDKGSAHDDSGSDTTSTTSRTSYNRSTTSTES